MRATSKLVASELGLDRRDHPLELDAHPSTPPLYEAHTGYQVVPVECVYAVIEVKSSLDWRELKSAAEKLRSVKSYEKRAFTPDNSVIVRTRTTYGRDWPYFPIVGLVFAFNSGELVPLAEKLSDLEAGWPTHELIDGVYVLNRGVIVPHGPNGPGAVSYEGGDLAAYDSDNPLRWLTLTLQSVLVGAWMDPFRLQDYYLGAPLGTAIALVSQTPPTPERSGEAS